MKTKTLGVKPTFAETLEYYDREDVSSFIYRACLNRKICMFFAAEMRWSESWRQKFLTLESPEHLEDTIVTKFRNSLEDLAEDQPMKFYPSFHEAADMLGDYKDFVLEADCRGWRKSFDDLYGALRILDEFQVVYRVKFSGHRSLHLMIPWEAFPGYFNGKSVKKQWKSICDRIRAYFVRHGGLRSAHRPGGILRIAYSLNENTGLVSLPIASGELEGFRPWEAGMHQVKVDLPWFEDVPEDAQMNTERFLSEVFANSSPGRSAKLTAGMEIKPKDMTFYTDGSRGQLYPEKQIQRLRHESATERIDAAWNIMVSEPGIPVEDIARGLEDENATVRWFLTEALQRKVGQESALELAFDLLLDRDEYVRVSATDFVISAYEANPSLSVKELVDSSGSSDDMAYIIRKVCAQNMEIADDILEDLIDHTIKAGDAKVLANIFRVINSIISIQPMKKMLLCLFRLMSHNRAPRESIRILEDFWPNNALTRVLSLKLASSLGFELPRTRLPRVALDDAEEILSLVDATLAELTEIEKMNMLATMLLSGRKPTRVIATRVIKLAGRQALPPVIDAIKSGSLGSMGLSAREVAEVLKEIDPDPVGSLLEPLRSDDVGMQQGVLLLLRALDLRKAVKHLMEMLKDRRIRLRVFVVRALGGIRGKKATEGLLTALKDRNRLVRMEAIQELKGRMNSPGVRDAISERQQDRSKHVRAMAREILKGL